MLKSSMLVVAITVATVFAALAAGAPSWYPDRASRLTYVRLSITCLGRRQSMVARHNSLFRHHTARRSCQKTSRCNNLKTSGYTSACATIRSETLR